MRPIQLTMQAFGSYGEKTTIDFTVPNQNLFLVTGDTGAGKTTIFDAICFALYGEASSVANKKAGVELQSQFVDYGTKPFVELTFSEIVGGQEQVYTVCRSPQHMRPKARGTGETHETEKVSLLLPDDTEFSSNQKETDQKIEEIVGLTKGQFMQVAMIAQGEFMELLRAKSDDKKVIFRKLFHTELYQKIVEELGERRRDKAAQMAQIKTICQQEVSHIEIPATDASVESGCDSESSDEMAEMLHSLRELKERICSAQRLNTSDMEQMIAGLKELCDVLGEQQTAALKACTQASTVRDEKRDAYTKAEGLSMAFSQLERASDELAECKEQEPAIAETVALIKDINVAYDLLGLHETYTEAQKAYHETTTKLAEQKEQLPALSSAYDQAIIVEEACKLAQNEQLEAFSKISERVGKALEVFGKIALAKSECEKKQRMLEKAQETEAKTKEQLEAFLADVQGAIAHLDAVVKQQSYADAAVRAYENAKSAYADKKEEYDRKSSAFLDAQAGLIAKTLVAGEPCPVCGSTEHPAPAKLVEEVEHLTRELIDELSAEVTRLDQARTDASTAANEAALQLEETRKTLAEKRQRELRTAYDDATSASHEAKTAYETTKETLKGLTAQQDYEDEAKARGALAEATVQKEAKEKVYHTAHQGLQKAKAAKEMAETLIGEYTNNLPQLEEKWLAAKGKYEAELNKAAIAKTSAHEAVGTLAEKEEGWKQVVATHKKAEIALLQAQVDAYQRRKAAAEGAKQTALETIGEQSKPDLEILGQEKAQAETALSQAQEALDQIRETYRINKNVYDALAPKMEERSAVMKEHTRIDSLYNRLAGNVTGARMDIETFVLRYYLQRILHAANARFLDMSAGQFELRMVGEDAAGAGKNRGLDLMVYSNITGKEREVRTLSGGESFMAALSLALGMADMIQENSSSINLDVMFIDEGFGSLDDHSREQAVKVLQRMASGQKLIGIISHVTELKQKIDDQLVVRKDEKGSHVRWEVS